MPTTREDLDDAGHLLAEIWTKLEKGTPLEPAYLSVALGRLEREGYVERMHDEYSLTSLGKMALSYAKGW